MKKISKSLILIVMLMFMTLICTGCTSTTTTNSEASKNKVTLEKFNKIETGMTYNEVVEIIGEEGTLSSESSFGEGTEFETNTKIYYWYAENRMSNVLITFSNDKVSSKTQTGLK